MIELCSSGFRYGGGETEIILGHIGAGSDPSFKLATKANPFKATPQPVEVGLSPSQIRAQFTHSLKSLNVDSVDLFYLHAPDHDVPIAETLAAVDSLYKEQRFRRFGLSNFAAWQISEIWQLCDRNNYVKPTVYQGTVVILVSVYQHRSTFPPPRLN